MPLLFPHGGDGGADLGECGGDVGRNVVESFAGVVDGDAYEVDSALVASERGQQGVVLVCFFFALLVAAEVPAEADFE